MKLLQHCPICNAPATALDVVDFNKACIESEGKYLPLAGIPIYYFMCDMCSFTFSPYFWNWTENDFLEKIYNEDYITVDPEYLEIRPKNNADVLLNLLHQHKSEIKHLDYGGGNGRLSRELIANGWNSQSFDPFVEANVELGSLGQFNLISAFEVFEHVPHPDELMKNITALMGESCLVLFSTLLSDNQLEKNSRINWWYCSPRNGHISLFSKKSLAILGAKYQLKSASFSDNFHCFVNNIPLWARHFIHSPDDSD